MTRYLAGLKFHQVEDASVSAALPEGCGPCACVRGMPCSRNWGTGRQDVVDFVLAVSEAAQGDHARVRPKVGLLALTLELYETPGGKEHHVSWLLQA
jgi:hypothetical protein